MHEDAPAGLRFGEVARVYERSRPQYPPEAVDWLLAATSGRVVDVGAGTGKLTRSLVGRVGSVVAVEPDAGMRAVLSERVPAAELLDGTAERIPLADGEADAVLVAQAWHWVDPRRAVPEVARVLRSGGVLGLVWNDRDDQDAWVRALSALLAEFGASPDGAGDPQVGPPFGDLERAEFPWTDTVDVDTLVDLVCSRSYVIALPDARRADLVGRLRELAHEGADPRTDLVPMPYRTRAYRARLP